MEITEIIEIKKDRLYLNSFLNQTAFGKTNMISMQDKTGLSAIIKDGKTDFQEFNFESTFASENGRVFFVFPNIQGRPLCQFMESDTLQNRKAVSAAVSAISEIIEKKFQFEPCGAGGIIIEENESHDINKIHFLPFELFEQCARNAGELYAEVQGKWINKNLSGSDSAIFTRSVISYKALTNSFPFKNEDTTKRQEDIFDEYFTPLSIKCAQFLERNKELAESIDAGLKIVSEAKASVASRRRQFTDKKAAAKRSSILSKVSMFDTKVFEKLLTEKRKAERESADFSKSRESFEKKQKTIIFTRRLVRRNIRKLQIASAIAVFALWAFHGFQQENSKLVTTKGLNSIQTTAVMYNFINSADVPNLQEILKGKKTKDVILKVTGFYVRSKERQGYNQEAGTVTPAQRLFFKEKADYWMYGITNLSIDEMHVPVRSDYPQKKDKPEILRKENGKELSKGSKVTHKAKYYLVHSDAARINAEKITETVELTWNGKRWLVTNISGDSKNTGVKVNTFLDEYFSLLSENDGDIGKTTESLKEKYEWLPAEDDMLKDAKELYEIFGSTAAEKFILTKK